LKGQPKSRDIPKRRRAALKRLLSAGRYGTAARNADVGTHKLVVLVRFAAVG